MKQTPEEKAEETLEEIIKNLRFEPMTEEEIAEIRIDAYNYKY